MQRNSKAWSAERGTRGAEHRELRAPRSTLHASQLRCGFTLLEMLLATLISVILMGALYVAMDVQVRQAQIGRDVIEQGTLAHNLLARISRDIKKCVTPAAPIPPPPSTLAKNLTTPAAATSPGTPTSGSTDSSSANSSSSSGSTGSSSSPGSSSTSLAPTRDTIQFQLGVQGGATTLTLYVSQLPRELDRSRIEVLSDLRLISYWLATDGSRPLGLARREFKQVTADSVSSSLSAANGAAEPADIIAPEVVSLQFRYFDGTSWVETWDGSQTGADFLTPVGPPPAIEITLGIQDMSSDNRPWGQPTIRHYRHVVPILTADGVAR